MSNPTPENHEHDMRLTMLEREMIWMKEMIEAIKDNTDKMVEFTSRLAVFDERHMNMYGELKQMRAEAKEVDGRVTALEKEAPTMQICRDFVFKVIGYVISGAVVAVITLAGVIFYMYESMRSLVPPH